MLVLRGPDERDPADRRARPRCVHSSAEADGVQRDPLRDIGERTQAPDLARDAVQLGEPSRLTRGRTSPPGRRRASHDTSPLTQRPVPLLRMRGRRPTMSASGTLGQRTRRDRSRHVAAATAFEGWGCRRRSSTPRARGTLSAAEASSRQQVSPRGRRHASILAGTSDGRRTRVRTSGRCARALRGRTRRSRRSRTPSRARRPRRSRRRSGTSSL